MPVAVENVSTPVCLFVTQNYNVTTLSYADSNHCPSTPFFSVKETFQFPKVQFFIALMYVEEADIYNSARMRHVNKLNY